MENIVEAGHDNVVLRPTETPSDGLILAAGQRRQLPPGMRRCRVLSCSPCPFELWEDVPLWEPPGDCLEAFLRGEEFDVVRRTRL